MFKTILKIKKAKKEGEKDTLTITVCCNENGELKGKIQLTDGEGFYWSDVVNRPIINHPALDKFMNSIGVVPILKENHIIQTPKGYEVITWVEWKSPAGIIYQGNGEANYLNCTNKISNAFRARMAYHRALSQLYLRVLGIQDIAYTSADMVDFGGDKQKIEKNVSPKIWFANKISEDGRPYRDMTVKEVWEFDKDYIHFMALEYEKIQKKESKFTGNERAEAVFKEAWLLVNNELVNNENEKSA